jgi:hypothetical protein
MGIAQRPSPTISKDESSKPSVISRKFLDELVQQTSSQIRISSPVLLFDLAVRVNPDELMSQEKRVLMQS